MIKKAVSRSFGENLASCAPNHLSLLHVRGKNILSYTYNLMSVNDFVVAVWLTQGSILTHLTSPVMIKLLVLL